MTLRDTTTPIALVIFGITGDLSKRKLLPSLFDLDARGLLPDEFTIYGLARREHTRETFRQEVNALLQSHRTTKDTRVTQRFLERIEYVQGDYTSPETYVALSDQLLERERQSETGCLNKLFYLAVAPSSYDTIFRQLADSGLTIPCAPATQRWTRILVEKPFGRDVHTAQTLDRTLGLLFREDQIFRIDHYLGKEVLQDLLMFRFSNLLFQPVWNATHIDRVEIVLHEQLDVAERGAFYDGVGALRDVGQNHILQMLAFIAMENPGSLSADSIRRERTAVLDHLRLITPDALATDVVRGQYRGYRDTPGVHPQSQTETFFSIRAHIDNDRWRGVPFYLESGKALAERKATIKVYFKESPDCLCPHHESERHRNILTFNIQPDEGISIVFYAKRPGFDLTLDRKKLSFVYDGESEETLPDAYERILYDAMSGDQTMFTSTDEVRAAWKFVTPIIDGWDHVPLIEYDRGSPTVKLHDE